MPIDLAAYGYAAIVAGGGIFGYVKSKSIPSLAAGLLFGSILGYGAHQISNDQKNIAVFVGAGTVLGGLMGFRFYHSGKLMPAGMLAALSFLMVIRAIGRYFSDVPPYTRTE